MLLAVSRSVDSDPRFEVNLHTSYLIILPTHSIWSGSSDGSVEFLHPHSMTLKTAATFPKRGIRLLLRFIKHYYQCMQTMKFFLNDASFEVSEEFFSVGKRVVDESVFL